jgi:aminoglycoside phosphotransferase (APT) family kinase protein
MLQLPQELAGSMPVQVSQLVAEQLGVDPLQIIHMDFGHNSLVYAVTLSTGQVIVRTNVYPQVFAGTAHNLTVLAALGLPVPRILAADLSKARYPFAYLILSKILGRDLRYELPSMTPAQMSRLAGQIVDFQRQVATLPLGQGYGYVPINAPGQFGNWLDKIQQELHELAGWANTAADPTLLIAMQRAAQLVAHYTPYLRSVPPTCFLDDVTTKNVIVQQGELQGLVDFDVVCYGDPLYMPALTATAIVADIGPERLFYVEELCRHWGMSDEQRRIVALYAALCGLYFLRHVGPSEPAEWTARMLSAVEGWLAAVERQKTVQ